MEKAVKDYMLRAEEAGREARYADSLTLGERMVEARMIARKGKGTNAETRLKLEYEIARLSYDMAYMMEENDILRQALNMAIAMENRIAVLEKAVGGK